MSIKQPVKVMTLTVDIFIGENGIRSEIKCQGQQAASDFADAYMDAFGKFHPVAIDNTLDQVNDKKVTEVDIRPNQSIVH
ncbi:MULTISPECIES: hypothetical protein [Yersinia]|uniref:hypothetical protein n=1 Tax=Yersinia TaxID=629 RepID=UPI000C156ECD|nr:MULTISPECIES: hypothetical protein [Yersinia]EKN3738817.1 hypothetical protein [Yersinia enterocolitica]MDA5523341.1 hypothetical protein [Yersinia kristensenii]MDA5544616.1 hypothetical protein [Yersinia rochesterensis]PHZ36563.1 hypothetical protein CS536_07620 [Yersinia kristensenii]UZM75965.1 hypothetical protein OP863_04750 [Yersinia sp. SCPM-O-B-9106 (C-191)]